MEARIPRAAFGNPASMKVMMYMLGTGDTYPVIGIVPTVNPTGDDAALTSYFAISSLDSAIAPNGAPVISEFSMLFLPLLAISVSIVYILKYKMR